MSADALPIIRAVVVDDQEHFRHGLCAALRHPDADIQVVGEATNGEDAIALVDELQPDVAILDIRMPGAGGISAARTLAAASPHTRVLMLTVSDDVDDVAQAMRAGAAGYLLKDRSLEDIADAVVAVAHGQQWPAATA